ncbi:CPBP family intramembrane glutamic endopeptidase [Sphingomonas xanthus]|uniref:CPBP family intramembrane glutamic endopeptidase n=1 Tax=Sphingomonas xanthus TaxID=2594473 RepID=UPI001FE7026D|nr:CPBP family intramembrane glutamic endopeptidase [Sphingomonas xanthus]
MTLVYVAMFAGLALLFDGGSGDAEALAFQLSLPGLEEELFYRGLILLALNEALRSRVRFLGIDWGWGALLSCGLFGLAHAFTTADATPAFDALYFALTALPSLLVVWLRERSGSLLFPVLVHNAGNSLMLFL